MKRLNEKSDYNALRRAKDFIKNATSPAGFYDKIREILKDAFIEDWDIKQLQRLADAKYYELTRGVKEGLNNRRDRTRFITKMVDALVKEPYGYSHEEANDIAIKHADDVSADWCGYGNMDACIRARLRHIMPKKEYDAEYRRQRESIDLSKCHTRLFYDDEYDDEKTFYAQNRDNIVVVKRMRGNKWEKIWYYLKDDGAPIKESYKRRGIKESIGDKVFRLNDINLKDWYTSEYPDDDLGYELFDDVSLRRCYSSLGKEPDIYDVMGVADSVIRERVFAKMAEVLDVDYDDIYYKWLGR